MAALINEILEDLSSSSLLSTLLRMALIISSKASTSFQAAETEETMKKRRKNCQLPNFIKKVIGKCHVTLQLSSHWPELSPTPLVGRLRNLHFILGRYISS